MRQKVAKDQLQLLQTYFHSFAAPVTVGRYSGWLLEKISANLFSRGTKPKTVIVLRSRFRFWETLTLPLYFCQCNKHRRISSVSNYVSCTFDVSFSLLKKSIRD